MNKLLSNTVQKHQFGKSDVEGVICRKYLTHRKQHAYAHHPFGIPRLQKNKYRKSFHSLKNAQHKLGHTTGINQNLSFSCLYSKQSGDSDNGQRRGIKPREQDLSNQAKSVHRSLESDCNKYQGHQEPIQYCNQSLSIYSETPETFCIPGCHLHLIEDDTLEKEAYNAVIRPNSEYNEAKWALPALN